MWGGVFYHQNMNFKANIQTSSLGIFTLIAKLMSVFFNNVKKIELPLYLYFNTSLMSPTHIIGVLYLPCILMNQWSMILRKQQPTSDNYQREIHLHLRASYLPLHKGFSPVDGDKAKLPSPHVARDGTYFIVRTVSALTEIAEITATKLIQAHTSIVHKGKSQRKTSDIWQVIL